jgi:hypothetical protein
LSPQTATPTLTSDTPARTIADISIRIVQCDYVLTQVRDVPSAVLAENPDLPLRQPFAGKVGKTRDAEVRVTQPVGD